MAEHIERKIVIGCIVSTDFLKQIRNVWDPLILESAAAKRIAGWCWDHFDKYGKAPGKEIETIFFNKTKNAKFPKDIAEEIEDEILPSLSKEYENESFNLSYYLDETQQYITRRKLILHKESIESLIAVDKVEEAEKLACDYKPIANNSDSDLDLSDPVVLDRLDQAFAEASEPLIEFPKQLGDFMNDQLIRGGLVAFLASEKRGKSYVLLEMAMRSRKQGKKVAVFQAGDMTLNQWLKRTAIYLAQKSDQKRYAGKMWQPLRDCIYNQRDDCDREERTSNFGIFPGKSNQELRQEITLEDLVKAYKDPNNQGYNACSNCEFYKSKPWGTPWIKEVDVGNPLTVKQAKRVVEEFFIKHKRAFKLSTHANGTLTIQKMRGILSKWEKEDFIPDVIIIDYADLLEVDEKLDERAKQNSIWKGMRRLSQEKGQPLVITVTQADAKSYDQVRLRLSNFSEDKRKYAHVTTFWGLSQDPKGREKKLGILRINELVKREGEIDTSREITILQNLKRGRPFIASYW